MIVLESQRVEGGIMGRGGIGPVEVGWGRSGFVLGDGVWRKRGGFGLASGSLGALYLAENWINFDRGLGLL